MIDRKVDNFTDGKFKAPNFNDAQSVEDAIKSSKVKGNVFGFLFSKDSVYVTTPVNKDIPSGYKEISYIRRKQLPEDKKHIILSATADEWIYRKLYGDRIKFIDISDVELKGKIVQYSDKAFSRGTFKKNKARIDKVKEFKKELDTITFKAFCDKLYNASIDLYFGKCEGSNQYSGKDLKIIDTPHINSISYRLMSRFLGVPTTARDFEFTRQKVRNNGYEFNFMTSANEYVRRIQFFCIEKELIQAIGRARLLNHDCRVYLFSDYPVPYAEQHSLNEIPTPVVQLQPNIDKKAA